LSIRPKYADAIFSGEKRFEFRRTIFRRPVQVVVVYITSPVKRVIGEFDVEEIISDTVESLWRRAKHSAGIERDDFFEYFRGRSAGHAISIGSVRLYPKPLEIAAALGTRPPQSWVYLREAPTEMLGTPARNR